MKTVSARKVDFTTTLMSEDESPSKIFPYLRDDKGDWKMWCVSPVHGRSFVVDKMEDKFIVTKGNGLSYTPYTFLNTGEMGDNTWGFLATRYAVRDFLVGNEIRDLGIMTNKMHCVIELDVDITTPSGFVLRPALLQYSVVSPYRISDAPFMETRQITAFIKQWETSGSETQNYLSAAKVLISNLRILHEHDILHNAINEMNYTWALELVDFELSSSPNHPWESEDYQKSVPDLFDREIMQTYLTICYIAGVLKEPVDFYAIGRIFHFHGFEIEKYKCEIK